MYNGGIIGKKNLPTYFNGNGIRNAREVRNFLEDGLWHFDAAVTANASSYTEGDSISISINTTGLPDGTNLYWTVNTLSGTTLSTADFTDKVLDGTAYDDSDNPISDNSFKFMRNEPSACP